HRSRSARAMIQAPSWARTAALDRRDFPDRSKCSSTSLPAVAQEWSYRTAVGATAAHFSGLAQQYALLGECADRDVVTIWIAERKLFCSCGGVRVRLLVESGYKSAGPVEYQVEIVDAEKQE